MNYPFHKFAEILPLLEGPDFDELVADIRAHGLLLHESITLLDGAFLDGRNRYRACLAAGVKPHFWKFTKAHGGPLAYVISQNLHRRHLTPGQRAMIAARLANMRQGERTDIRLDANQRALKAAKLVDEPSANLPKVSQSEAAKLMNVSHLARTRHQRFHNPKLQSL